MYLFNPYRPHIFESVLDDKSLFVLSAILCTMARFHHLIVPNLVFFLKSWIHKLFKNITCVDMQNYDMHGFELWSFLWQLSMYFFGYKKFTSKGWTLVAKRVRACMCVTMKKSARRMASMTSDTGDTSSKQQQAERKENYNKCVFVPSVFALDWWGYCPINMWIEREYNVEKKQADRQRERLINWQRGTRERGRERERERERERDR